MTLLDQLADGLRSAPDEVLFEYDGRDYRRGDIRSLADRTIRLLDAAGVPHDARLGVIARNRVLHAAAMLGLIAAQRSLTTVYAMQSPAAMALEIVDTRFGAVIADHEDWTAEVCDAVAFTGAVGLVLDHREDAIAYWPGLNQAGPGPFSRIDGEPGLEILSSGTTGTPKRILFPFRMLVRAVESVAVGRDGDVPEADIQTWPYGGIGGMCNLVAGVVLRCRTILLDRFSVPNWVAAIRKHRPVNLSGPPAVARMAIDAGVSRDDLASVRYFFGGGAPFPPDLQDAFEAAYDIKVIWAYGATEFCGTIISWTPALHERYHATKQGAMGRPLPGISVRVTDPDIGTALAIGEIGRLEAIVPAVADDWIRTTDLASIDADGFVFHHGRGDGAIVRGGFKVMPEKIVAALQSHSAILDAAVVGLPDHRLGEVPVAAVELRHDASAIGESALRDYVRELLVVHHVPTRILIVERLPRTTSLKVDLSAVKALFGSA